MDNNNYVLDRMKQLLFLMVLVLVGMGCKPGVPSGLIQPAEMEQVLYNVHMVDGMIGNIMQNDSAKKVAAAYYKGIYEKFDIDSAQFAHSMDYYYSNPVVMSKMYTNIVARLEKEKKKLDDEDERKRMAIINKARGIAIRDSLTKLLFIDTTKKDSIKLDTIKINYAKMSKSKIKSLQVKNDSIKVKIDSVKKVAEKKKEFVIQPRRAYFWGKK